jgi:exonuclease III
MGELEQVVNSKLKWLRRAVEQKSAESRTGGWNRLRVAIQGTKGTDSMTQDQVRERRGELVCSDNVLNVCTEVVRDDRRGVGDDRGWNGNNRTVGPELGVRADAANAVIAASATRGGGSTDDARGVTDEGGAQGKQGEAEGRRRDADVERAVESGVSKPTAQNPNQVQGLVMQESAREEVMEEGDDAIQKGGADESSNDEDDNSLIQQELDHNPRVVPEMVKRRSSNVTSVEHGKLKDGGTVGAKAPDIMTHHSYCLSDAPRRKANKASGRQRKAKRRIKGGTRLNTGGVIQGSMKLNGEASSVLKMVYGNVQGKVNCNRKQVWKEIESQSIENNWDVIAFCETHWKMGVKGPEMPGYARFDNRRDLDQRKGGGVAIWVKNDIEAHEWLIDDKDREAGSEILWVVLRGGDKDIAVGVVYMGVQSTELESWNDAILDNLKADIRCLKEQGKEVALFGDFNGHITKTSGGLADWKGDRNGRRVLDLAADEGLAIVTLISVVRASGPGWREARSLSLITF